MQRTVYNRRDGTVGVVLGVILAVLVGCQPQQPFYLKHVDGDLAHYKGVATEIEYPDVDADRLADVSQAKRPFSLTNNDTKEFWNLRLEEAIQIALTNNKVMRNIGGQIQGPPDFLLRNPSLAPTIYDPALAESNPRTGVEAALSAFDAKFSSSLSWERVDNPNNYIMVPPLNLLFPVANREDLGTFQAQLSKVTATGGEFSLTHNVDYVKTNLLNNLITGYPADWNVNLVAEMRQPLLQGAGVEFNRIAGPGATPGVYNGVVLARINTDIALADFEASVRNLVSDVETAYWELYFNYRSLDAVIAGRNSSLSTWRRVNALNQVSARGGEAERESQAREQYYVFSATAERSLNALYSAEAKLRYLLGLAATDGRLIRPAEEPSTAKLVFDWCEVLNEGLVRSIELREEKWIVKHRELELIASKNFLLPRLDFLAQYRWLGMGNRLDGAEPLNDSTFMQVPPPDSNAYRTMTSGEYQEWQMGFQLNIPLGYRREMAGVRNSELALVKERAKLQEMELELSHQLAYAVREMEANYVLSETNFNRRLAAQQEVEAISRAYQTDTVTIDRVLAAQRALAEAESEYYRSLVDYMKSITQVHFRKGSLLDYDGVYLAEGPWPAKAYFDARRRARAREAGLHLDYGFSRPEVISRGPMDQQVSGEGSSQSGPADAAPPASPPGSGNPVVAAPNSAPVQPGAEPSPPPPMAEPQTSAAGSANDQRNAIVRLPGVPTNTIVDPQVSGAGWTTTVPSGREEADRNPSSMVINPPAGSWKGIRD